MSHGEGHPVAIAMPVPTSNQGAEPKRWLVPLLASMNEGPVSSRSPVRCQIPDILTVKRQVNAGRVKGLSKSTEMNRSRQRRGVGTNKATVPTSGAPQRTATPANPAKSIR